MSRRDSRTSEQNADDEHQSRSGAGKDQDEAGQGEGEGAKSGQVNRDDCKKCSQCSKKETTMHCVHCGWLVCRACRGNCVRGVMNELRAHKDYVEAEYPRAVRERLAVIAKVAKDLEEKKRKAMLAHTEGFRDLRKEVDAREKTTMRKLEEMYNKKKAELHQEANMYQGHLEENKRQNDKMSNEACSVIHFPVGKIEDGQLAGLCQARKRYVDIIQGLHKPDERPEPIRSKLAVKFDKSRDDTFKAVGKFGLVRSDYEEEGDKKKKKEKTEDLAQNEEEEIEQRHD